MGTTNFGTQTITFDYKEPGKAENFNLLNYKLLPSGIYDGASLSKSGSNQITLSTLTAFFADTTNGLGVRVSTSATVDLAVAPGTPYIVLRFLWSNVENNYMDVLSIDYASLQTDDIIVGRCVYISGTLQTTFDYTRKTKSILSELKSNDEKLKVVPSEPYDTKVHVYEGELVTVDGNIEVAEQDSPVISNTTLGRIDLVYIDSSGVVQVEEGVDAGSPVAPDYDGKNVIAEISRGASSTYITGLDITDLSKTKVHVGSVYTQTEIQTFFQEEAEDKKELGEIFFLDKYKAPVAWSWSNKRNFFPAKCLSTISTYEDIDVANWPDWVPDLRAKTFAHLDGTGSEDSAFDVTDWDVTSNVATLTFANTTAENAILAALLEDKLVHGSYTNWRSITLAAAIGDITAGEYAITEVDTASRTVKFAFTVADNSGSGTFTVNFYQHRVPGSTTTARVFQASARSLVSANDDDAEAIAGMRRRDRGQQLTGQIQSRYTVKGGLSATGAFSINSSGTDAPNVAPAGGTNVGGIIDFDSADSSGARTGTTTDPRSLIGHLYIWGKTYNS